MFEKLTTTQKMASFGNEMINRIIKRTQDGFTVFERKFKPYSTKPRKPYFFKNKNKKTVYVKSYFEKKRDNEFKRQSTEFAPNSASNVNLTLTGDMLNSLQIQTVSDKGVVIGLRGDQAQKAFWNEENKKRIISAVKAPVSRSDEKFIAKFFDKQLVKAMKESSGKTEIIIG